MRSGAVRRAMPRFLDSVESPSPARSVTPAPWMPVGYATLSAHHLAFDRVTDLIVRTAGSRRRQSGPSGCAPVQQPAGAAGRGACALVVTSPFAGPWTTSASRGLGANDPTDQAYDHATVATGSSRHFALRPAWAPLGLWLCSVPSSGKQA